MTLPLIQPATHARVLLADDEAVTRRLLEAHLERAGYEVVRFHIGDFVERARRSVVERAR